MTPRVLIRIGECLSSLLCIIPVAMTENDAERFRQEAEECRSLAERSASPLDKEAWLRLAADWIKLAENADQRRRRWLGEEKGRLGWGASFIASGDARGLLLSAFGPHIRASLRH
jgi:hypothetical protein